MSQSSLRTPPRIAAKIELWYETFEKDPNKVVPPSAPMISKVLPHIAKRAREDWKTGKADERHVEPGSIIDLIFIESGWSKYGVPKGDGDKIDEWCNFSVCRWLLKVGLNRGYKHSFYHVDNTVAFFTYGALRNTNPARYDSKIKVDGLWMDVEEWHVRKGETREWYAAKEFQTTGMTYTPEFLAGIFQPGACILFDWATSNPYHIGVVEFYDPETHIVYTIEGNRKGEAWGPECVMSGWVPDIRSDSVVRCAYSILDPRIYGVGLPSVLDFHNNMEVWK